eukprot:gnl/TRDRNA2_/TRDRNA2_125403_c0_seq2.p1 gnl/TRDRNA2_/TRDRNA2_125403_c0~~gnl/TRDRNA2_/TRDRNA2_125403_c0_seq2.p1  ORF type:complete len:464 (-),score=100.81 gnl/TRDRNA2_/TRDRNA2_125403_c0_seq2:88-1479(-)
MTATAERAAALAAGATRTLSAEAGSRRRGVRQGDPTLAALTRTEDRRAAALSRGTEPYSAAGLRAPDGSARVDSGLGRGRRSRGRGTAAADAGAADRDGDAGAAEKAGDNDKSKTVVKKVGTLSLAQLRALVVEREELWAQSEKQAQEDQAVERELSAALAKALQAERLAEKSQAQLQSEVDHADSDFRALFRDLPELLEDRRSELRERSSEVEALTRLCEQGFRDEEEYLAERNFRRSEVDMLWQEREGWQLKLQEKAAECRQLHDQAKALRRHIARAHEAANELQDKIKYEVRMKTQANQDLRDSGLDTESIGTAMTVARRRHEEAAAESYEQTESFVMAKRLEAHELRETLALHHRQLIGKSREAVFWHERAALLSQEFEVAQTQRGTEMTEFGRVPADGALPPQRSGAPPQAAPAMGRTTSGPLPRRGPPIVQVPGTGTGASGSFLEQAAELSRAASFT